MLAHIKPDWLYQILDWPFNATGGYPLFSGIGLTIFFPLVFWWRHVCITKGCYRWGHADPEHGHPLCRRHQDKLQ